MRKKPYTEIGIKRIPCKRCGKKSSQQWNVCSMIGFYGVCDKCDIDLNEMVLKFFKVKNWKAIIEEYKNK